MLLINFCGNIWAKEVEGTPHPLWQVVIKVGGVRTWAHQTRELPVLINLSISAEFVSMEHLAYCVITIFVLDEASNILTIF